MTQILMKTRMYLRQVYGCPYTARSLYADAIRFATLNKLKINGFHKAVSLFNSKKSVSKTLKLLNIHGQRIFISKKINL